MVCKAHMINISKNTNTQPCRSRSLQTTTDHSKVPTTIDHPPKSTGYLQLMIGCPQTTPSTCSASITVTTHHHKQVTRSQTGREIGSPRNMFLNTTQTYNPVSNVTLMTVTSSNKWLRILLKLVARKLKEHLLKRVLIDRIVFHKTQPHHTHAE